MAAIVNLTDSLSFFCAPFVASAILSAGPISASTLISSGWMSESMSMISADGTSAFVRMTTVASDTSIFVRALQAVITTMVPTGGPWEVGITGSGVMSVESADVTEQDLSRSESITLPITLGMLAFTLRTPRFLLLTISALVAALMATFGFVLQLAHCVPVPTFTISFAVSSTIAISLDYSLFLFSYLGQRLKRTSSLKEAAETMGISVADMLESTGHTIMVSGATLSVCFLTLAICPLSLLRWSGVVFAASVCSTVLANLTLVPALLLQYPCFWSRVVHSSNTWRPLPPALVSVGVFFGGGQPPSGDDPKDIVNTGVSHDSLPNVHKMWHAISVGTQTYKRTVFTVLTLALIVPFAPHFKHWKTSEALEGNMPRGSPSLHLFRYFREQFGVTTATPSILVGISKSSCGYSCNNSVLQPSLFAATQAAARSVYTARPDTLVLGIAWNSIAGNVSLEDVQYALDLDCPLGASCPLHCLEVICSVRKQLSAWVSSDGRATMIVLYPSLDTNTDAGIEWGRQISAVTHEMDLSDPLMSWFFIGDAGIIIAELSDYMFSYLPTLAGAISCIVFATIGVAFRSFVIPLRTLISIGFMVVATYGTACAVFQLGVLDNLDSDVFTSKYGLQWFLPVICFPILVGLGLDYDIFLLGRIMNERDSGWNDRSAIIRGVEQSGPIISWAGAIMAVAFGGLLSASLPLLNQLSFFIVFAVLIDTFVIRTFLVPAVHGMLGSVVWWPFKKATIVIHTSSNSM